MQAGDHATETVAAQALPKEAGQLGVSVRYVDAAILLAVGLLIKCGDNLTQSE